MKIDRSEEHLTPAWKLGQLFRDRGDRNLWILYGVYTGWSTEKNEPMLWYDVIPYHGGNDVMLTELTIRANFEPVEAYRGPDNVPALF